MSVLVCGGAGYIGSHINKLLTQKGYDTIVFDNLVCGHREAVKWGRFIEGDLADTNAINHVFSTNSIDAVFHFAAFAYVGESMAEPGKYYINNVANTLNLLEAMRKNNCRTIIFSSSCATYGEPDKMPITENTAQNPINPYGESKLMVENIFKAYERAYGLRFVALRYFNAAGADVACEIGENHNPETHLIPLILDAAMGKRPHIKVFGDDYPTKDGSCIRDYIHVSDLADAHVLALDYLKKSGKSDFFNLGNTAGVSVLEVIEVVRNVTGKDFPVIRAPRRDGDPPVLVGSAEKAMSVLGWNPQYPDMESIVEHAWRWHKKIN